MINNLRNSINEHITEIDKELNKVLFINYGILNRPGLYKSPFKKKEAFVVAGGPSLINFKFGALIGKHVIVSNMSLFKVTNARYFVTTDYTFMNYLKHNGMYKKWESNTAHKIFVANMVSSTIKIINGQVTDTNCNLTYDLSVFDEIIVCKSPDGIGYNWDNFKSGYNSGFCSFQLAVILGYNPIYLLGFDLCSKNNVTHHHESYGRSIERTNANLYNYSRRFREALIDLQKEKPNIKVYSCSDISVLNEVIEYKPIEEVLNGIK